MHAALDTLGHLLALRASAVNEQDRAQVGALASEAQATIGGQVQLAYVGQGHSGAEPAKQAS